MDEFAETLLARNARHLEALPEDHFADVQEGQAPEVVSVCCSDSRVSQEGMWDVEEAGWLFTPSNIGNQVVDTVDGETVVDGGVLYPLVNTGTRAAVVVGHTGCGAVTAAYHDVQGTAGELPPGIAAYVDQLVPVVEAALEDGLVDPEGPEDEVIDRLVEANVDHQVATLLEADVVPEDVRVYGFVYDLHATYGGDPGRAYLVNRQGTRDPKRIREHVPEAYAQAVRRLDA